MIAEPIPKPQPSQKAPPLIDAATVKRLTPMPALISALRRAFAQGSESPLRHHYEWRAKASLLVMPAWREGGDIGVKLVTVCRDVTPSIQASYLLMDGHNGQLKALIDGAQLTSRRTAAASALAADMLAIPQARCHLVLGTGTMVPHLVEAHRAVRPIDRVLIWGRNVQKSEATADQLCATGIDATAITDRLEGLQEADIVSAATLSQSPIVIGRYLKPGAHVDLVGAFRGDMCEADAESFSRARVFVDTRSGALEEAGDLLQAIASGAMSANDIEAELTELCSGRHAGRGVDPQAITLFKSVGASIEDLAAAELVFNSWSSDA